MSPLETTLRLQGETLLFALFGGTLVVLAIAETRAAMRAAGADRRHRWPTNVALTLLNIAVMGAVPLSGVVVADWARGAGFGLLNHLALPGWAAVLLCFLAFSLQSWAVHLAMHKVPLLWRMHRVHHTDTHLDVSTTVRFHPLEILLQAPIGAAVVAAVGAPAVAVILYGLFDALVNAFSHANLRLPPRVERPLSWLIVTPHLHRIHHSPDWPETDTNFGATLPLWDRLFGTFLAKTPDSLAVQGIGLHAMQDRRAHSLVVALTLPFRSILRDGPDRPRDGPDHAPDLRPDP
jgi:sterol desaturase/sphingolipid hydroxylase (fatty acid hydroxylase superfamily)